MAVGNPVGFDVGYQRRNRYIFYEIERLSKKILTNCSKLTALVGALLGLLVGISVGCLVGCRVGSAVGFDYRERNQRKKNKYDQVVVSTFLMSVTHLKQFNNNIPLDYQLDSS